MQNSVYQYRNAKDKIELVAITGIESICANVFKNYPKLKKVYTNGDANNYKQRCDNN